MKKSTWVWAIWFAITLGAALFGAILLGVSLSPFNALKPIVDSLAADGDVEMFTLERFSTMGASLRLVGLILLGLGVTFYVARRQIQAGISALPQWISRSLHIFSKDLQQLWQEVKDYPYDRRYLLALTGLTALALGVRLIYLSQPMRYDEAYTFLVFATRPLPVMISNYHVPNNHVFHTLLVGLAYRLLGNQPWVIRLPALIAGVLMVPAAYLLGKMAYGRVTGLLAAALVASASFLIEYSTDARGYTLVNLITLLIYALGIYLKDHRNTAAWAGFVLLATLGFYTLPIMLYPFGAIMLWLLLSALVKDVDPAYEGSFIKYLLACGLATAVLTILLYTPILVEWGPAALAGNRFVSPLPSGTFWIELWGSFIATWRSWTRDLPTWAGWIFALGFAASLVFHRTVAKHRLPLSVVTILWCWGLVLLQRVAPWPRVWLFMMPLFFVWVSAGIDAILHMFTPNASRPRQLAGIVSVLAVAVILSVNVYRQDSILDSGQTGTLKDAEAITLSLKEQLREGDVVVSTFPSNYPLEYYFDYYGIPETYLYRPRMGPEFKRALIVVNRTHPQTLEEVLRRERLAQFVDPARAEIVEEYESATIYEYGREN